MGETRGGILWGRTERQFPSTSGLPEMREKFRRIIPSLSSLPRLHCDLGRNRPQPYPDPQSKSLDSEPESASFQGCRTVFFQVAAKR